MNCHYLRNQMSAFIDQELAPEEKRQLRSHLFSCPECHAEYQELLQLKNHLENLAPPEFYDFDFSMSLRLRLTNEESALLPSVASRWYWLNRIGLITVCLTVFFVSAAMLFPAEEDSRLRASVPDANLAATPVSMDRNISIDQSVTVYQAAAILP